MAAQIRRRTILLYANEDGNGDDDDSDNGL